MSLYLTISANFRTGTKLPSIENQYNGLWELAKFLETVGFPITEWFPPAATPAASLLNQAFSEIGPSPAALAMTKADKANLASDLRILGVWNGTEGSGGAAYTTTYNTGRIPSNLDFSAQDATAFQNYRNVAKLVQKVIDLWQPMLVKVAPSDYGEKSVFPDRPPVGWMIYLPLEITSQQVPEAAQIVPIMDAEGKTRLGTLIITTEDTFDVRNADHVRKANAIETRLVDQDLLPTLREFVTKF